MKEKEHANSSFWCHMDFHGKVFEIIESREIEAILRWMSRHFVT